MAIIAKKPKAKRGYTFILMVGDDGAILVQAQGKKVIRRLFAPSPEAIHTKAFEDVLKSSLRSPITMLIDLTDQSYARQTLPPVSGLSVGKIIKRRMEKDFPPDDINGYRMLGREKTGRKDWSYLMVSVANSLILQKWISFAVERPNPFYGMGVVPLEAEAMLLAAEKELLKKKGKNAAFLEWQMLISHHKVGGFRQIVLRNGKLVFTRMAQLVGEMLPEVIAGNVEQEMTNTLEYLKRMGLQDLANLSVIVVASGEIRQALERKPTQFGGYHFFTPYELGELLGLPQAAQPEDHFGDSVISAFINSRRKLILPLHTAYTKKLSQLATYLTSLRVAATLAALSLIAWGGLSIEDMIDAQQQTESLQVERNDFRKQLDSLHAKAMTFPKELKTYTDVMTLSKIYDKRQNDVLSFLSVFAATLQNAAVATELNWSVSDPLAVTKDLDKRMTTAEINLRLTSPRSPGSKYIASAAALINRITQDFKNYEVKHTELPGLVADSKELQMTIDDSTAQTISPEVTTQIDTVKVTIQGPQTKLQGKNGR